MSGRGGVGSKLAGWLWRAPRRALGRARDLYVRSLTGCAGHLPSDAAFGYGYTSYAPPVSRSMSASSSMSYGGDDEDMRELVRAASERRREEQEKERRPAVVPRSQSVAMARIDEDRPSEFPGSFGRSRSVAVVGVGGRAGGVRTRGVASLAA